MKLNIKQLSGVFVFVILAAACILLSARIRNETGTAVHGLDRPAEGGDKSKVLLVNSYHKGLSWTDEITSVIEKKITGETRSELFIEYLDAKRSPVENVENQIYNLLLKRYRNVKFKSVIVSDNNALAFVKKYRTKLFPDTPVIFCGINNFSENLIDSSGWITGVIEKTDIADTFNIMRAVNPKLRSCIVVGDNTPTGDAEIAAVKEALGSESSGVKIIYWVNLSTGVLIKRLGELNRNDDAVLLTVFNRDAEADYYSYEESSRFITYNSSAPVYGLWDFYIGRGVVGGHMVNAGDQGSAAAEMVIRIINGEDHSKIPILRESPNKILFDYSAMNRFNIKKSDLPEGSIVLNTPHSLIMDNLGIIASALLLILLEGAALLSLFAIYMKSRKKAMKDIEESEKQYRLLVDNSFDVIYRINAERIITFTSPSWTVLLGHNISDVTGRPYTDFIHPEDAGACEEFVKKVILSGERQSGLDYRIRHLDGTWHTHTSSAVPVLDDSGNFAAFVGIAKDITDRKNAENEIKKLLYEKELLLKEVHHRIKNNMGTISSLLYLQADSVKNDIAAAVLNDARNRVQSMMVIYDKLYRSADFRNISSKDYLTNLINGVSYTFTGSSRIDIIMDIEEVFLDSEILFPVGIIINELLSNSSKYAFTDKNNGIIKISFIQGYDKRMEVIFKDNGIGIPEDVISGKSSGFGMNLVKILVKQIKGDMHVDYKNGTEYRIYFTV